MSDGFAGRVKYLPIIAICLLTCVSVSVAQKKTGSRRNASKQPEVSVRLPYRIEIAGGAVYPPEIVLGIGQATVFHLPEPAYQVIFGNKNEIAHAETNEETGRDDIYVRARIPNLRTNMIFEFKTGTLILDVRTVDRKGGVRPGDYHGEVFVRPQAISRPGNPLIDTTPPRQPARQKELTETKEQDRKLEGAGQPAGGTQPSRQETTETKNQQPGLQSGPQNTQSDFAKTEGLLALAGAGKKTSPFLENVEQEDDRRIQRVRIELLEASLKEKNAAAGAIETLLQNLKMNKVMESGGLIYGQFGKITRDELGRYWVGVYLRNANKNDISLLTIRDAENSAAILYWSGRFPGRQNATLHHNQETYLFGYLLPFNKKGRMTSVLELSFSSRHTLRLEVE
jgi:hypothetical protein